MHQESLHSTPYRTLPGEQQKPENHQEKMEIK